MYEMWAVPGALNLCFLALVISFGFSVGYNFATLAAYHPRHDKKIALAALAGLLDQE